VGLGVEPGADCPSLTARLPHDETMRISHEAIYQSLYVQAVGLCARADRCLRTGRALRVHGRNRGRGSRSSSRDHDQRAPSEVADRVVPGTGKGISSWDWDSSAIGTLVERTTRFTMLLHLRGWRSTA